MPRTWLEKAAVPAVLLAAVTGLCIHAGHRDFLSDDAFITLRYARNLLDGHGLVYNVGERVEGFSSPLHVLVLSGLGAFGVDLLAAGRGLGLVAAGVLVALAGWIASRGVRFPASMSAAFLASGLVAASPSVAIWSLAGLETTLYAALLLACLLPMLSRGHDPRAFSRVSVFAALAAWARPEAALTYGFLLLGCLATAPDSWPDRLLRVAKGALLFAVILGGWVVFRYIYYGDLMPNTYYVKSAFTTRHMVRGLDYLRGFGASTWVAPAFVLGIVAVLRGRPGSRVLGLALLAQMVTVVLVGGDGLPAYRFLVPAVAPLAVLAAQGADVLRDGLARRSAALGWVAVAASLTLVLLAPRAPRDNQFYLFRAQRDFEMPNLILAGKWLRTGVPAGTTIAAVPIGAVGYYSGLPVIDMLGLTDRHIAKRPTASLGGGWAGHEKTDGAYVLSRRPDLLVLGNVWVSDRYVAASEPFPPWTNRFIWARERDIASDPRFGADYARRSFRIGTSAYLNLWVRREADFTVREWSPAPL